MVKGNLKASASSGTRKKHARKAEGPDDEDGDSKSRQHQKPRTKDGKKLSKAALKAAKESRPKVYIPPQRPVSSNPDPLDTNTTGLVHRLPPELVVVLRSLGKKAAVTRTRALEELQEKWANEENIAAVLDMLPVWLHHAPALFVHPNRRLRLLSASFHGSLFQMHDVRSEICSTLSNSAESLSADRVLGSSCLLAHDIDRAVAAAAFPSWSALVGGMTILWDAEDHIGSAGSTFTHMVNSLAEFCRRTLADPLSVYSELTPSHAPVVPSSVPTSGRSSVAASLAGSRASTPASGKHRGNVKGKDSGKGAMLAPGKGKQAPGPPMPAINRGEPTADPDVDFETDTDRAARLRVAALGSVRWLVNECIARSFKFPPSLVDLLGSSILWSALCATRYCPFLIRSPPLKPNDSDSSSDDDSQDEGDEPNSKPQSTAPTQESEPGVEPLGHAQPSVRRAAWGLVAVLVSYLQGRPGCHDDKTTDLDSILPVLTTAVLRCAWIESDPGVFSTGVLMGVLGLLKAIPHAWQLEASFGHQEIDFSLGSSPAYKAFLHFLAEGCFPASPAQAYPVVVLVLASLPPGSLTVRGLPDPQASTECSMVAHETALPNVAAIYTAFWQSLGSRALTGVLQVQRAAAHAAFLGSFVECVALVSRRIERDCSTYDSDTDRELHGVVSEQYKRALNELASGRLRVPPAVSGTELARGITMLRGVGQPVGGQARDDMHDLSETALDSMARQMRALTVDRVGQKAVIPGESDTTDVANDDATAWTLVLGILKSFEEAFGDQDGSASPDVDANMETGRAKYAHSGAARKTETVLSEVLHACVSACDDGLSAYTTRSSAFKDEPDMEKTARDSVAAAVHPLALALEIFGRRVLVEKALLERVDNLIQSQLEPLISVCPSIVLGYIQSQDEARSVSLWNQMLALLASRSRGAEGGSGSMRTLFTFWLDAARAGKLPACLKHQTRELDQVLADAIESCLAPDSASDEGITELRGLVIHVVQGQDYFLSQSGFVKFMTIVGSFFTSEVDLILRSRDALPSDQFEYPLRIFRALALDTLPSLRDSGVDWATTLLPSLFVFAFLLPRCSEEGAQESNDGNTALVADGVIQVAKRIIDAIVPSLDNGLRAQVETGVKSRLRELLEDADARPCPKDIFDAVMEGFPGLRIDFLGDVIPSQQELASLLDQSIPREPISPALAVVDILVLRGGSSSRSHDAGTRTKEYMAYARLVEALVLFFNRHPGELDKNPWAIRHLLEVVVYEEDCRIMTSSTGSASFALDAKTNVEAMLASDDVATWRKQLLQVAEKGAYDKAANDDHQSVPGAMAAMLNDSVANGATRDVRVLHVLLGYVLKGLSKDEGEQWMAFARRLEKSAPLSAMAIILSIAESGAEPTRLERYRNELAASLPGIPARKANKDGLLALQMLAATAPDLDSDVAFLPQQRAVQLVKGCQQWILSDDAAYEDEDEDEGLSENVESAMALVFVHILPILQNVPGAHWDLVFDVIESNLEACDLGDQTTLTMLSRTLRLVRVIEDLVSTNKTLRSAWMERRSSVLVSVKNFAKTKIDSSRRTVPTSICLELVLSLLEDVPSSFFDESTLSQMCHLVQLPSIVTQKMSYNLLSAAARKRTEHFVIEAGVNTDDDFTAALPVELIELISSQIDIEQEEPVIFGNLLAWMVLFDLFTDASLRVKSSYVSQLRSSGLIANYFLPNIFHVLSLDIGHSQAFKLDPWSVEDFYVSHYEGGTSFAFPVLAAHLYYRALTMIPSLIHSWIFDCKDRRLSTAVTSYTTQHFSPVLIRSELSRLKEPDLTADLVDDVLSVKVAANANEITVLYNVDERQLEIRLKIPSDWPLHRIEVKDVQRYGVDDRRWRAWILGVQQTVWSQNGRIIDALSMFKKNVSLHFSGQSECAICYSIISVVDGALPRQPCNTCKNRFHASCLFKWFNTSHTSSCPLCRSDII